MKTRASSSMVETLRWREGRLELIDQRVLPARVEFVACSTAEETARAIRDMVVRGAPAIGCAAAPVGYCRFYACQTLGLPHTVPVGNDNRRRPGKIPEIRSSALIMPRCRLS